MWILDSTLREGEQTPGVCFPLHVKLEIAELLSRFGVRILEAGHPAVSPRIREAVSVLAARPLTPLVAAHARSTVEDVEAALECGVQFLGIFYCVSEERLSGVFRKTLPQAIDQIQHVISYARSHSPEMLIRYTPEDTVRSSYENVICAARAAVDAGANIISVADTTGFMVPHVRSMYDFVSQLREDLSRHTSAQIKIAVHCHNDRGLALANALDGLRAGAEIVDTSILGLGERAGIVDLASLIASQLNPDDSPQDTIESLDLSVLTELYDLVSSHTGIPVPLTAPVVGANAFTHCAGVHTHAAARNPCHYESLSPALFGRERAFALDHMSGKSSIQYALDQIGHAEEPGLIEQLMREVKTIGESGRVVSLREFSLLVRMFHRQSVLSEEYSYGNAR
ncbi:MAG: hypothetical protein KDD64_03245 [Bdellovibrionales bacterium]|nr:hypothetical protein [Bdellovibrionales bacterium]